MEYEIGVWVLEIRISVNMYNIIRKYIIIGRKYRYIFNFIYLRILK